MPLLVLTVTLDRQGQLHDQQFLINKSPPGPGERLVRPRRMDLLDRFANRRQVMRGQVLKREDLVQVLGQGLDNAADDAAHLALAYPFGQRVDRQELAARIAVVSFQILQVGVHHLVDAAAKANFARQKQFLPRRQPLGHERLIEPDGADTSALAADEGPQDRAARGRVSLVQLDHGAVQTDERFILQFINARQIGQVLIVAREEEDDVPRSFQSQLAQQLGPLRTDPFEELHGRRKQFGRRPVLGRRHRPILAKALLWQSAKLLQGGNGQLVAAFVLGMSAVPGHPGVFQPVRGDQCVELRHRSSFLISAQRFPSRRRQPLAFHFGIHSVSPLPT